MDVHDRARTHLPHSIDVNQTNENKCLRNLTVFVWLNCCFSMRKGQNLGVFYIMQSPVIASSSHHANKYSSPPLNPKSIVQERRNVMNNRLKYLPSERTLIESAYCDSWQLPPSPRPTKWKRQFDCINDCEFALNEPNEMENGVSHSLSIETTKCLPQKCGDCTRINCHIYGGCFAYR